MTKLKEYKQSVLIGNIDSPDLNQYKQSIFMSQIANSQYILYILYIFNMQEFFNFRGSDCQPEQQLQPVAEISIRAFWAAENKNPGHYESTQYPGFIFISSVALRVQRESSAPPRAQNVPKKSERLVAVEIC